MEDVEKLQLQIKYNHLIQKREMIDLRIQEVKLAAKHKGFSLEELPKKEVIDITQFIEELRVINGIGKKTAEDIVNVYPTKEKLVNAIKNNEELPFREDAVSKLKKHFE